jgi:hypothetical protein
MPALEGEHLALHTPPERVGHSDGGLEVYGSCWRTASY